LNGAFKTMPSAGFALFGTALGWCGVAWNACGIVAVQLPEASEAKTRARLLRHCPDVKEMTAPPSVQATIDGIVALLCGEARDLSQIALDMAGVPEFDRRVYELARTIAPGETLSYREVATRLGDPAAAREVGQALGRNPFPVIVPCHRVVAAGSRLGGFSAPGGAATKRRLLAIESAHAPSLPLFRSGKPR
jgi:methylated-DNA-[protein]-cysteine S-methyltransferase